jgi:cytidylate kinase
MRDITESDWKIFKQQREIALERFCERVLDEIARISSDRTKSQHERYLAIYRLDIRLSAAIDGRQADLCISVPRSLDRGGASAVQPRTR